ncbi:MAG: Gfo/Idh/MocA family oxidoreductase [Gemmatimonadetes bacterium]|nr:Gfo/Idh/MocA family oxidoreductase [Gemmatimonadota bacterium]MBT6149985.1 Gfo/Idh/MocA family oxidoreductase [Gemmatimonadota bacterium]MBT7863706.1 Gfo/Idh/MocA family oxidoreductase [Gemmatimonadota bacterium]
MQIRVGVAGLRRGRGFVSVLAAHPSAELVAIADPDTQRCGEIAAEYGVPTQCTDYDELLGLDLDAVVIATPAPLHTAQSIAALATGRHVLCEVPAVASLGEAHALVQAVESSSGSYMLAENVNYFDRTLAWQKFIDAGKLGTIHYAEAEYIHDCSSLFTHPDGTPTWRASLPPIHYCTHSLGPLLAWTGDRCVSVTGMHTGSHLRPDLGTIDMEVGIFRTANHGLFKILCGFSVMSEPGRHWYSVYGTKGMLESGRTADSPDRGYLAAESEQTTGPAPDVVPAVERPAPEDGVQGGHGHSEWYMVDEWIAAVIDGGPMPIDVHAGLDMTLPGICAHLSAQQDGQPVDVPDSRDMR